jgi:predicted membrane chloride channel (bestrophin family)
MPPRLSPLTVRGPNFPFPPFNRILRLRPPQLELRDQGPRGSQPATSENWDLIVSNDLKALVDALGGCERIAKTPMPFGYLAQLRIFILLWLISWPFALAPEYHWATVPLVSVCGFMMLKIEEMAVQIEHPFGTGANDLPIDTICVTIERNLLEIMRRQEYLRAADLEGKPTGFMARTFKK